MRISVLTDDHLPITAVCLNPFRVWILSCGKAFQIAYGRSEVLPGCPHMTEISLEGASGVFSQHESWMLNDFSC